MEFTPSLRVPSRGSVAMLVRKIPKILVLGRKIYCTISRTQTMIDIHMIPMLKDNLSYLLINRQDNTGNYHPLTSLT